MAWLCLIKQYSSERRMFLLQTSATEFEEVWRSRDNHLLIRWRTYCYVKYNDFPYSKNKKTHVAIIQYNHKIISAIFRYFTLSSTILIYPFTHEYLFLISITAAVHHYWHQTLMSERKISKLIHLFLFTFMDWKNNKLQFINDICLMFNWWTIDTFRRIQLASMLRIPHHLKIHSSILCKNIFHL
jgi:hypothetical protein